MKTGIMSRDGERDSGRMWENTTWSMVIFHKKWPLKLEADWEKRLAFLGGG